MPCYGANKCYTCRQRAQKAAEQERAERDAYERDWERRHALNSQRLAALDAEYEVQMADFWRARAIEHERVRAEELKEYTEHGIPRWYLPRHLELIRLGFIPDPKVVRKNTAEAAALAKKKAAADKQDEKRQPAKESWDFPSWDTLYWEDPVYYSWT